MIVDAIQILVSGGMKVENMQQKTDLFLNDLSVDRFSALADEAIRASFEDLVSQLGGDAGAIWIVDKSRPEELAIAVNVGARGSQIEGSVSQDLKSGLVSKAFREKLLVHDKGVFRDREQSMDVDMKLGQYTVYQIAGPFSMFGDTIGAVTIVQLSSVENAGRSDWGFDEKAVEMFANWSAIASRLFEYAVVKPA